MAIMQGRLVPPEGNSIQCFPRERWRDEFALAAEAGLDAIEWIYDAYGAEVNPIATDVGIAELRALACRSGVHVASVCADYFLDFPLVRVSRDVFAERTARLLWLIERCRLAGVERVVLPFVDAARIDTEDDRRSVVELLRYSRDASHAAGIELHLETSLAPEAFAALLSEVQDGSVGVTYDSGNSASLGYDVEAELAAYGPRIGSVHVKDRVLGGASVPIGTGNADLSVLFGGLSRLGFTGDFVLQVARGFSGDEVAWIKQVRSTVTDHLRDAGWQRAST